MAIRTTFELFDIISDNADLHIDAKDKAGDTQHVVSASDARRYIIRKYATRRYTMLSGGTVTAADAGTSFVEDFTLWIKNRQHNIDKQYQALFNYDYSPIENVDRYETESVERDLSTLYGKTDTESGTDTTNFGKVDTLSGSDSTTYGKVDTLSGSDSTNYGKVDTLSGTDSLQHGKVETNSGTDTTNFGKVETNSGNDVITDSGSDTTTRNGDHTTTTTKAGFNSPNAYTPSEKVAENFDDLEDETSFGKVETTAHGHKVTDSGSEGLVHGHVVTDSGTDSTTYGKKNTESGSDSITYGKKNTESGSDSVTYGKKNTESGSDSVTYGHKNTQGGTDKTDDDTSRELHVHGNVGVSTNNQLIEAEIEMRNMSLAEMLLDNFINDYTYYS